MIVKKEFVTFFKMEGVEKEMHAGSDTLKQLNLVPVDMVSTADSLIEGSASLITVWIKKGLTIVGGADIRKTVSEYQIVSSCMLMNRIFPSFLPTMVPQSLKERIRI